MISMDSTEEGRWAPLRLRDTAAGLQVEWVEGGPVASDDFELAASALRAEAAAGRRKLHWTDIATLEETGSAAGPDPAGFIFHVSRCGSTLLTSVLAALEESSVVAESVMLDDILDKGKMAGLPAETISARLRGFLRAHARLARPGRSFVKFDCDHLFHFELIRRTFPAAPWIFLYRDPLEVVVSHARQRGLPMVPAPGEMAKWEGCGHRPMAELVDEYTAWKIGRICDAAAGAHRAGTSLLVNYCDLVARLNKGILPFFGVSPNAAERERIAAGLHRDAKHPETTFQPDSANKKRAATPHQQAATERWARPGYERLEQQVRQI
jgi:hypothetical protein